MLQNQGTLSPWNSFYPCIQNSATYAPWKNQKVPRGPAMPFFWHGGLTLWLLPVRAWPESGHIFLKNKAVVCCTAGRVPLDTESHTGKTLLFVSAFSGNFECFKIVLDLYPESESERSQRLTDWKSWKFGKQVKKTSVESLPAEYNVILGFVWRILLLDGDPSAIVAPPIFSPKSLYTSCGASRSWWTYCIEYCGPIGKRWVDQSYS